MPRAKCNCKVHTGPKKKSNINRWTSGLCHTSTMLPELYNFFSHNKTVSFRDIIISRSTHVNETSTDMSERESSVTASDEDLLCKKGGTRGQTPNKEQQFAKYVRKLYLLKAETTNCQNHTPKKVD